MKSPFIALGGLLFSLIFFLHPAQANDLPVHLTSTNIDGSDLDFAQLKGSPVVLVFGATWCPDCRREAREAQKAYLAYKDKGVVFIGIYGKSSKDDVNEFIETYSLTFPVCNDDKITNAFRVRAIPTILIYGRDGKLEKKFIGYTRHKKLAKYIEKIIDGE